MLRPRLLVVSVSLALVLALGSCSSGKSHGTASSPTTVKRAYPLDDTLRLDQVQVLGSHNSYHARPYPLVLAGLRANNPGLADTLDYDHAPLQQQFAMGVRQFELDVWDDPSGGKYARPQYPISVGVKVPEDPAMNEPGYKVIHQAGVDTNSTCLTFVACLKIIKAWSDANPGHVPMQIQVEMKDGEVTEPMFERLEHEILSVFDRNDLITPDDVRGGAPTLGEAVRTNGWPTLGKVRGRVWFALDNEGFRDAYLKGHPSLKGRLLFAPSAPGEDDAAFAKLNDPIGDAAKIKAALATHMIVRTRADADTLNARNNDLRQRQAALNGGAQLVSTDYERPDRTLKTGYVVRIPGGTPARCNPVTAPRECAPTDVEDPALLTVRTR